MRYLDYLVSVAVASGKAQRKVWEASQFKGHKHIVLYFH